MEVMGRIGAITVVISFFYLAYFVRRFNIDIEKTQILDKKAFFRGLSHMIIGGFILGLGLNTSH